MQARFLVNARPQTVEAEFYRASSAGGLLFPPAAATAGLIASLRASSRRFLLADNGAFDDIGRLATAATVHADGAAGQWHRVREFIAQQTSAAPPHIDEAMQRSVQPDAVIGPEDITLATWLRAGIPEEELRTQRRSIAGRNAKIARRAEQMQADNPDIVVYGVASAHDFDTAFDAGRAFADAGIRSAAIGCGAFMADDQWTSTVKVRGRIHSLPRSVPARYLRTAMVTRGFFDGWATAGLPPDHFHFLGLGAPIMLPLAAIPAGGVPHVTFDATSPIRDAVAGSLYVSRPAPLTVKTWRVAENLANGSRSWDCPCGFCRAYLVKYPFDLAQAADAVNSVQGRPESADLRTGQPLSAALPLFQIGNTVAAREAERARIGHNHWVLANLCRSLSATGSLATLAERRVAQYERAAGNAAFAAGVRLALNALTSVTVV